MNDIPPKLARAFIRVAAALGDLTNDESRRVLTAALAVVGPSTTAPPAAPRPPPARAPFAARVARRARRMGTTAQVCSICKRPGHNARTHKDLPP